MRKLLLPLCLALAVPAAVGCDDGLSRTDFGQLAITSVGAGSVVNDNDTIAFTLVRPGDPADSRAYILENANEAGELTINSIEVTTESPWITTRFDGQTTTDCADNTCTYGERLLRPLSQLQFEIDWKPESTDNQCGTVPEGQPTEYCGTIVVTTDDPQNETVTLTILAPQASGTLQVCIEGGECGEALSTMFTDAVPGDPAQVRRFTVQNVGVNDLRVTSVLDTWIPSDVASDFSLESSGAVPPFTLGPSDPAVTFELTFDPQAAAAARAGTIRIESDASQSPNASIAVSVGESNLPAVEVDKTSLNFVNIQNPATDTQEITITNSGGATAAPLTVNFRLDPSTNVDYTAYNADGDVVAGPRCGMASPPATCTQPLVVERQSSQIISVTYAPTTAEASDGTLVLNTNDPNNSRVDVALTATGGTGFVVSDVSTLTWTTPAVGDDTQSFTVTNEGNAAISISAFDLMNAVPGGAEAQFALTHDALPIALGPTESTSVDVTYTQPDEMPTLSRAADIHVVHDGANSPTIVSLSVAN